MSYRVLMSNLGPLGPTSIINNVITRQDFLNFESVSKISQQVSLTIHNQNTVKSAKTLLLDIWDPTWKSFSVGRTPIFSLRITSSYVISRC